MQSGSIRVADHEGAYIIRLEGDVRLTLCTAFDAFIQRMLDDKALCSVMVDCSDATGMDSTTLGQLARLALGLKRRLSCLPVLFCPDADLRRLLESMGFEDVFNIDARRFDDIKELQALPVCDAAEAEVRKRVLQAHRTLMSMNEHNRAAFAELVENLERNR